VTDTRPIHSAHSYRLSTTALVVICLIAATTSDLRSADLARQAIEINRCAAGIVGGRTDAGHPAVGLFRTKTKPCTATLIGKRTVLTAAHAIDEGFQHIFVLGGVEYEVESAVQHPRFTVRDQPLEDADPLQYAAHDVAIVRLRQAPPVEPAVLNTGPLRLNMQLAIVGLGETRKGRDDRGVKRVAENTIAILFRRNYQFNDHGSVCHGDSGGPSFAIIKDREVLVGVHSVVSNPCGAFGVDMRVDFYIDWIKDTAGGDVVLLPAD